MAAYYNEINPYAADWLRALIAAGHIAPGDVDTRSILDVHPDDIRKYTQCHFFAGIGIWSLAARRASWSDDRSFWTGSCPCQPFSAAGAGNGLADERHLWPHFHWLISECRPSVVLGEQVASPIANPWVNLVHADMEGVGYGFAAVPFPSAGVGAPHIRDRIYWLAVNLAHPARHGRGRKRADGGRRDAGNGAQGIAAGSVRGRATGGMGDAHLTGLEGYAGHDGAAGRQGSERSVAAAGVSRGMADAGNLGFEWGRAGKASDGGNQARLESERLRDAIGLADTSGIRLERSGQRGADAGAPGRAASEAREQRVRHESGADCGSADRLADTNGDGCESRKQGCAPMGHGQADESDCGAGGMAYDGRPGPTNGPWRAADWLLCRDGKWRPVEPGTFPLAHGNSGGVGRVRADQESEPAIPRKDQGNRSGRLSGYGNSINAYQAQIFFEISDQLIMEME